MVYPVQPYPIQRLDGSWYWLDPKTGKELVEQKNETVYLVKFDRGYYAKKQRGYHWSFTDDPYLAQTYKTFEKAEERGYWGIRLIDDPLKSYTVEKYVIKTTMELAV